MEKSVNTAEIGYDMYAPKPFDTSMLCFKLKRHFQARRESQMTLLLFFGYGGKIIILINEPNAFVVEEHPVGGTVPRIHHVGTSFEGK